MSLSSIKIVLGNSSLVGYPQASGLWIIFIQYVLGLKALNHDVYWLELYRSSGKKDIDHELINIFFERMKFYGIDDRCILLLQEKDIEVLTIENARIYGKSYTQLKEIIESADILWNFANALKKPILSLFKNRALIDIDPGHLQVSALEWDMGQYDHEIFLTVGSKINDADCEIPDLGLKWHTFNPFVYLPIWKATPDPGSQAPFTSITQWNWGELWLGDKVLSISKRDAYLKYLELPGLAHHPFELAVNIHKEDSTGDRELLSSHDWKIVDPHNVAESPCSYQNYIMRSRAELLCPKPIFRELKTGWFSDRSACYLASGRPVLAEDTGFSDHYPVGSGLLSFQNLEEAIADVTEIDKNFAHHSKAAREIAEDILDSSKCLNRMLSFCSE